MRRLTMLTIAITFVIGSCSSAETTSSTTPPSSASESESEAEPTADPVITEAPETDETEPAATAVAATDVPSSDPATDSASVSEDDLARFIAATERALVGTDQESVVFDDPEIYIALGQASCARFSAEDTFEQIATDLLEEIDTEESDDETRLVGAVIGAATQTLCPEHADKI